MWPCYRLVAEGWTTLDGLKRMTLDEVDDANDMLDAWQEATAPRK